MKHVLFQTVRPNWMPLIRHQSVPHLKFRPSMIGVPDLHTFHNCPVFQSFQELPDDPYMTQTDHPTRQRRYGNYEIKVRDPHTYDLRATDTDIFEQNVADSRGTPRQFERLQDHIMTHAWLLSFITQISALAHLQECKKRDVCLLKSPIKTITVDVHQVRQICYPGIEAHNSPEGIHRDGADYIVSAFVANRVNIVGGESIIYNEDYDEVFHEVLKRGEGMFQEDRRQLHYVEPISPLNDRGPERLGLGFRDIFGIDVTLT